MKQNIHGMGCVGCDHKNFKSEFSTSQWSRKDGQRLCKKCEAERSHNGLKKQCRSCGEWHCEDIFDPSVWRKRDPSDQVCFNCVDQRKCTGSCGSFKCRSGFSEGHLGVTIY